MLLDGHGGLPEEAPTIGLRQPTAVLKDRDVVIDHDVEQMPAQALADAKTISLGKHPVVLGEHVEMPGTGRAQDVA